jgi:HAD superfamily hydrolase (TIGR01509 family)
VSAAPLFLFDCDKTLYAHDSKRRLPALARLGGESEYRIAKDWWEGGFEERAEAGEWPTAEAYLAEFARVTGARLTLPEWAEARRATMTPIPGAIEALRIAATLGTVGLLSNNPAPMAAAFPLLAPEAAALLGDNVLVSADLGAKKPSEEIFERALDRLGGVPSRTFFADDLAENVDGAAAVGITAFHFTGDTGALQSAVRAFGARWPGGAGPATTGVVTA